MNKTKKMKKMAAMGALMMALFFVAGLMVTAAPANAKTKIGVSAAKKKALANAKLKAKDVTFTKAKLDKEDGVYVYEIEFYSSSAEYEYEINAYTGKVVKKEVKKFNVSGSSTGIGAKKAKSIALKDAGFSASQVTFTKVKLDKEDGVYEVEFRKGKTEYEYEIDADTGEILESDSEYDD